MNRVDFLNWIIEIFMNLFTNIVRDRDETIRPRQCFHHFFLGITIPFRIETVLPFKRRKIMKRCHCRAVKRREEIIRSMKKATFVATQRLLF
ncbi:hypothetical protein JL05_20820 [Serratia nematodiphila DZ0503SBS1]|nr:hypothetical protein JL05_20820 [Serratia nematodiphila DZ0503SBS1]